MRRINSTQPCSKIFAGYGATYGRMASRTFRPLIFLILTNRPSLEAPKIFTCLQALFFDRAWPGG